MNQLQACWTHHCMSLHAAAAPGPPELRSAFSNGATSCISKEGRHRLVPSNRVGGVWRGFGRSDTRHANKTEKEANEAGGNGPAAWWPCPSPGPLSAAAAPAPSPRRERSERGHAPPATVPVEQCIKLCEDVERHSFKLQLRLLLAVPRAPSVRSLASGGGS